MSNRITTNDLAKIMRDGFDAQGKQLDRQGKRLDAQETQLNDLAFMVKQGFDEQGQHISELKQDMKGVKNELYKTGDSLAGFINRFETESAATLLRLDRIEDRLDRADIRT